MNSLAFVGILGAAVGAVPSLAAADLVTHTLVSYSASPPVTVQQFGTVHATSSNSYTSPGSFSGTAEAWAGYGLVRTIATAQAQNASFDTHLVQAEAAFSDLLTVTGGTGTGFIVYHYSVTGFTVGSEHQAHAHAFLRHGNEPDEELGHLTGNAALISLPHSFTFGAAFSTGLLLAAEVHFHQGHSGPALADFSAGAMLAGVSIFNSQMQPVTTFAIASQSGTQYPLPGSATSAVLVIGLAMLNRRR